MPGLAQAALTFPLESRWSSTLEAPLSFAPAYDDAHAYLALRNKQLVAVSLSDGKTAWSVECPMSVAPTAGDSMIFSAEGNQIQALSRQSGARVWQRPMEGLVTSLYWDTGWLIVTIEMGPLVALRALDGEVLWQRDFGSPLNSPPAPAGERVYLALKDGRLVAAGLMSGDEIWTAKLPQAGVGIFALADRLYVGALDGRFYCLETRKGNIEWSWPTGNDVLGLPVVDERRVYFVALDNVLRAHDRRSGTMVWKTILPMRPSSGPLSGGDSLIVAGVAVELYAYSARDGKPAGKFTLQGSQGEEFQLAAPPYLSPQGLLLITTRGGQLHALASAPAAP
jgi:outer membrane protein assembly factor BamB